MDYAVIQTNVPTCGKLGFDSQFAAFAVPFHHFVMAMYVFRGLRPSYYLMPAYGVGLSIFSSDPQHVLWLAELGRKGLQSEEQLVNVLGLFVTFAESVPLCVLTSSAGRGGCRCRPVKDDVCTFPPVGSNITHPASRKCFLMSTRNHVFAIGWEAKLILEFSNCSSLMWTVFANNGRARFPRRSQNIFESDMWYVCVLLESISHWFQWENNTLRCFKSALSYSNHLTLGQFLPTYASPRSKLCGRQLLILASDQQWTACDWWGLLSFYLGGIWR